MDWHAMLLSPQAMAIYGTIGATLVAYVLHWLENSRHLDLSRWNGLITDAYNFAESEGLLKGVTGDTKGAIAMQRFMAMFPKVYAGASPTPWITDAVLDFAKLSFQSKMNAPAAPVAVAPVVAAPKPVGV